MNAYSWLNIYHLLALELKLKEVIFSPLCVFFVSPKIIKNYDFILKKLLVNDHHKNVSLELDAEGIM